MQFILKKFLILSLLTLVIPVQVKSHDIPAHEICINASDYNGCIRNNTKYSNEDRIFATGVIASVECMVRNKGTSRLRAEEAIIYTLKERNIPYNIREVSIVKDAADKLSYLLDDGCRNRKEENQDEYERIITSLLS